MRLIERRMLFESSANGQMAEVGVWTLMAAVRATLYYSAHGSHFVKTLPFGQLTYTTGQSHTKPCRPRV